MEYPILRYPDPKKSYTVFTDASGIGWSGVLTQEYPDEKGRIKHHPICYVSGQFRGSQLNWAALTKEAYAIYMSIRQLAFYVSDADVTIRCDHLPLKKFLTKQTLNSKVNNWAVELEQFNLKLEWIMGSKNTLADTLSRLLDVCPEAKLEPEPDGQEFGSYCFEDMKPVEVKYIEEIDTVKIQQSEDFKEIKLPLQNAQMELLQRHDDTCRGIAKKLRQDKHMNKLFMLKSGMVYRLWCEDGKTAECVVVPEVLKEPLLMLAHNYSGHNGFRRTYNAMKRQYYWPGMRKDILKHCKRCHQCSLQNQGTGEIGFDHFEVPSLPMEFICMDLVGPISPQTSKGNRYMLTVIDMMTGYTIAVAIPDKRAETVCKAYRDNVYCTFGGSSRILTDNGTEFKCKEMRQICEELDIKQVFSPVYTPQVNGRLEGWHRFLKSCIAKHIRGAEVEWDDLIPLAVSAYNFFPCQSSKESPFVLMFGRDPITPIAKLLEPKLKFYGEKGVSLRMDTLRKLYTVVAENIRKAREKQPRQGTTPPKVQVNDLVLVKDPESAVFEPRYMPNYRVTAIFGRNRIEVQDKKGNKSLRRAAHVKACQPVDKVIGQLPPQTVYEQYGRTSKLLIHPKDVPHIPLQLFDERRQTTEEGEKDINMLELNDSPDESRSRTQMCATTEKCNNEIFILDSDEERLVPIDEYDESKNREIYPRRRHCQMNVSAGDSAAEVDICDASRNRSQLTELRQDPPPMVVSANMGKDEVSSTDSNDESKSRTYRSTLTVMCGNEQQKPDTVASDPHVLIDANDESRNRNDRWPVSNDRHPQHLVSSEKQGRNVESVVVNRQDVDERLLTNKYESVTQHSTQASNQWLFSAFSKFTSNVLGKSKNTSGEEFIENINTKCSSNPVFKSEFNFFL